MYFNRALSIVIFVTLLFPSMLTNEPSSPDYQTVTWAKYSNIRLKLENNPTYSVKTERIIEQVAEFCAVRSNGLPVVLSFEDSNYSQVIGNRATGFHIIIGTEGIDLDRVKQPRDREFWADSQKRGLGYHLNLVLLHELKHIGQMCSGYDPTNNIMAEVQADNFARNSQEIILYKK
jgi:hypothetical protein